MSLGTLSTTTVSSVTTTAIISTDNATGYTLAIREVGALSSGAHDIADVADGTVTAGSEEYGVFVGGTDAIVTSTIPILQTYTTIAASTGTVTSRSVPVGFYAAVATTTEAGVYTHTVRFLATVNP
jgi:hypothetical protein